MENGFSLTYVDQQEALIGDLRLLLGKEKDRAEAAEAALAERDKPCVWVARRRNRGGGTMIEPTCKREADDFGFISAMEAPATKFCPNCGHPIKVQP